MNLRPTEYFVDTSSAEREMMKNDEIARAEAEKLVEYYIAQGKIKIGKPKHDILVNGKTVSVYVGNVAVYNGRYCIKVLDPCKEVSDQCKESRRWGDIKEEAI